MKKSLCIAGDHIEDIPSFYAEINRVLMQNEDWQIGHSLDALNDLLYGNFGEIKQDEPVQLIWQNSSKSEACLGLAATQAYYADKLAHPAIYNVRLIREKLTALETGHSPTFFEMVIEIINEHKNIELIKC